MTERQVAVIGLGLIGASLGGALRAQGYVVRGTDEDDAAMQTAVDRGLVDDVSDDLTAILAEATLVILAIPVLSIIEVLPEIDALSPREAVIADVGSVKGPVIDAMKRLSGASRMIGGHPIAGKEQSGPAVADVMLFQERSFALVPSDLTSASTIQTAQTMVREIGGVPVILSALEHDHIIARTSHLPQLLAMALALSLEPRDESLAGPGLRDMTRLAASGANMWKDILVSNADNISAAVEVCMTQLQNLTNMSLAEDKAALEHAMVRANERSALIAGVVPS
ncbi:MAG TPA: prephenate dehydrogenase/arogenate dehydrogenase family protein [Chloroflexota bacterium]